MSANIDEVTAELIDQTYIYYIEDSDNFVELPFRLKQGEQITLGKGHFFRIESIRHHIEPKEDGNSEYIKTSITLR
jgi:hypothetical protein